MSSLAIDVFSGNHSAILPDMVVVEPRYWLAAFSAQDDAGFVQGRPKLQHYEQPEWWETDMLPEALRHGSGHHGSHTFLTHEFIDALINERKPVVDIYEALTHRRAHRNQLMPYLAMRIIIDSTGNLFEPGLVKTLVEELSIYPLGSLVRLNTNEVGRVVASNKGFPIRPQVEILLDAARKKPKQPSTSIQYPVVY